METTGFSATVGAYLQRHIPSEVRVDGKSLRLSMLAQDCFRVERIGLFHKAELSWYSTSRCDSYILTF